MDEEKDEFLKEIDELLGGVDDETPLSDSKTNSLGSAGSLDTQGLGLEAEVNGIALGSEEKTEPPKSR